MQQRFRRGRRAEDRAGSLLDAAGFRILDRQVVKRGVIKVGGRPAIFDLRADFLAQRRGRRAVIEVKTGAASPRATDPATRRQLLEYLLHCDVDDAYLLDAEADKLHRITFPAVDRVRRSGWIRGLFVGAVIGTAIGVILAFVSIRYGLK